MAAQNPVLTIAAVSQSDELMNKEARTPSCKFVDLLNSKLCNLLYDMLIVVQLVLNF